MKNVEILPYTDIYKNGVVECLQRNYEWMSKWTTEEISEWISPVTDYEWISEKDDQGMINPYKKGVILVENNHNVVGYLGLVTSKRTKEDGKVIICGAPTTWAIDKDYRCYLIKVMKIIISSADVIYDFTARKSVEDTFRKIFRFDVSESNEYLLYPVPSGSNKLNIRWVNNADIIESEVLKRIYLDHTAFYGIRLIIYTNEKSGEKGYLFYKVYNENSARIRLLMIININLFVAEVHEIIWKILNHEFYKQVSEDELICRIMKNISEGKMICAECNKMLLQGQQISYPVIKEKRSVKLSNQVELVNDFMYTEIAMLPNMV